MLWCATLRYVMPIYDMLCYVMRFYGMVCYVYPCYAMLCYDMLCYVMLCYAMLCYVTVRFLIHGVFYTWDFLYMVFFFGICRASVIHGIFYTWFLGQGPGTGNTWDFLYMVFFQAGTKWVIHGFILGKMHRELGQG